MSDTETTEEKTDKKQPEKQTPEQAASPLEEKLVEDTKIASELPIPDKNEYWVITVAGKSQKKKRKLLPFLKGKELTEEDISQLRDSVDKAPGRAKAQLQEVIKDNPENADLMILFALCSYRNVLNSSNRKGALEGLKKACKDAAIALQKDGISLYNCEKFFDIYFEYLGRLKRFQVATYNKLGETVRQQELKKQLEASIKMCDKLIDEKTRISKVFNQIKGRFKSSSYNLPWEFADIKLAGAKVEQGEYRHQCGPAESRQLVVYILAILDVFARIPILTSLVDTILQQIPEGSPDLYLRKASVQATRAFTNFELMVREGDTDKVRAYGRQIYKTSSENLQQLANQHVKQSFEADPYFNLSRVTIMTFGLYNAEEQNDMLRTALKAIKRLLKLDMSKTRVFTQTALKMEFKLTSLMAETGKPVSA
ncbi:MAG: hypothetical protein MJE63_06485 [Proteobacteria bacterium]|nr:hypothetical protein [Pseudomonadota bacterium]